MLTFEEFIHLLISYTFFVQTVFLLHKGKRQRRSFVLALYSTVQIITNAMVSLTLLYGDTLLINFPQSHFLYKPLYGLWAPLFYFYVKYCFKPDYKLSHKHWFHFLPFAIFLAIYIVVSFNSKEWIQQTVYTPGSFLFLSSKAIDALVSAQLLLYITLMLIELRKAEKAGKQPEHILNTVAFGLNWMRFVIYFYTFSGAINFVVILLKMIDYPYIDIINNINITLFYFFFFAIFYKTISHRNTSLEERTKYKGTCMTDNEMLRLMKEIEDLMIEKKLCTNPDLSLQMLSEELHEKERNISQTINALQGRNVNDFINYHRIEYAKEMLAKHPGKAIFEIMYDSGFNTKGAFNLAFKKLTGLTPSEYKKRQFQADKKKPDCINKQSGLPLD